MEIIEIQNLRKTYAELKQPALDGISLSVPQGALFGLIGADGAGKSTLIKILATLAAPDEGSVRVLGEDVRTAAGRIRTAIGYMPQRFSLYHDLSVRENIHFFADVFGVKGDERRRRVERLLHFSRLGPFVRRRAGYLSGGMKQKLALCCALIHSPRLLLLDEPTTGVDPVSRSEFWSILKELVAGGVTMVVSTPYMDETAHCAGIAMLHEGKLLCTGTPAQLLSQFPHALFRVETAQHMTQASGGRALPAYIVRVYPAAGEVNVVARRDSNREQVEQWIRENIEGAAGIHAAEPVMEDVFIDRISGG